MPEDFLRMPAQARAELLQIGTERSGRGAFLLEKDVWVVWALDALCRSTVGKDLVFKGGTSLSKAYKAIHRFSEDVDLTYDIRALAPDLVSDDGQALPPNRSQEKKWTKRVNQLLPEWVTSCAHPILANALAAEQLPARSRVGGANNDKIYIDYQPVAGSSSYVHPTVLLEFGARSTGEPATAREITCDASEVLEEAAFPTARPRVMHVERTFWEKATAIHVFCLEKRLRGERFSRHWHDLVRLDEAGYAELAFRDRQLARNVARHKSLFFAARVAEGDWIDYEAAVTGGLCLTPEGDAYESLKDDYARMVAGGLLQTKSPESFETLMERSADIAARANR